MQKKWFNNYFSSIFADTSISPEQEQKALKLLKAISIANGGDISDQPDTDDSIESAYAVLKVDEAIQRRMNGYAKILLNYSPPEAYYSEETVDTDNRGLSFVTPKHLVPKLNLNRANIEQLAALPGIGNTTAKRIIEYRQQHGYITTIEEIKKVKGIGNSQLKLFEDRVYAQNTLDECGISSPEIKKFICKPSLKSYIGLLSATKITFSNKDLNKTTNPSQVILDELDDILNDTTMNPSPFSKMTDSKHAKYILNMRKRNESLENRRIQSGVNGRLIFDSEYLSFLTEMIKETTTSLRIIMFFMKYDDDKNYPTDELINEIINKKQNNVDIKVILDKDSESQVYGSRFINAEVYQKFTDNNIEVRYDKIDKLTHTKLVVSDGRHVVLGSHNWTAGSFYVYDDTSIYIDSVELAKFYESEFEKRWNIY